MKEKEIEINGFKDVEEFAGKVVCFGINETSCILLRDTKWPKPAGLESLNFGHIRKNITQWRDGNWGYNIAIFKGTDEVPTNCALTDEYIREAGLTMRQATPEEIEMLREVYVSGKGSFEYIGWPDSKKSD